MASSKDAADSKPEREKKTESSEDHGEPFEFTWVSAFAVPSTNGD